jgi:hypothetical protein
VGDVNEKTRIPLFATLCALPFLVGAVIWLTTIDSKASAAQEQIRGLRELLLDVRERVIRIEEQQKQKPKE